MHRQAPSCSMHGRSSSEPPSSAISAHAFAGVPGARRP